MQDLEKKRIELFGFEKLSEKNSFIHRLDCRCKILVTLIYLVCMLSIPLIQISELLLFCLYPIYFSGASNISLLPTIRKSLIALPVLLVIGIFNPIFDRQPFLQISNTVISKGWITFLGIILRGMLAVIAVQQLTLSSGFYKICSGLQQLRVPSILISQLSFVHRYFFMLIEESVTILQAYHCRAFRRKIPIRHWSLITGQLMIRSIDRSANINNAMLLRGFSGKINTTGISRWHSSDTLFLIFWCGIFLSIRIFHPLRLIDMVIE